MKAKNPTKLEILIQILSILQLALYCWAIYLSISANHKEVLSVEDALAPSFPALLFVAIGLVNLVLLIVYLVKAIREKKPPNKVVLTLVGLIVILTLLAPKVSNLVDKL